jgi:hypothetical protein
VILRINIDYLPKQRLLIGICNGYSVFSVRQERANKTAVVVPDDQNSVNLHKEPRDVLLQQTEVKHKVQEKTGEGCGRKENEHGHKEREKNTN